MPCQGFDTTVEAFKVLDPAGAGYVDLSLMRNLLSQMPGIGPVSDADMEVVLKLADSGKFTLRLLSWMDEFVAYWGFGDLHV